MVRARVLVVDDEAPFLRVVAASVRLLGYEAVEATSGEEALELAQLHRPDVILIDVRLPGIDGPGLASLIKDRDEFASTPVLLMSAFDKPEAPQADGFIAKPFDFDDLDRRLAEFISPDKNDV